ncbi:hypothetical protein [Gluconobacter sp. P5E10]|uniref:hypothetical protein n=1 Tax=Gluconobacter sp. P5E10 TaxID=2762613 RepID=UPI001C04D3EA|nr:hypothetical protein [Gluconobacter sp. P5E10]
MESQSRHQNQGFFRTLHLVIKGSSTSAKTATKIGTKVGSKVVSRGAQKGLINLTKMVPLLGGVIGGGANAFSTRAMGFVAIKKLKDGPSVQGKESIIEDFDITESMNVVELETFMEKMSESDRVECEPNALTETPKADLQAEIISEAKEA